jgi:tetratricopeptide (TPR) repeat protein
LIPNDPNPYDSYAELMMKMGRYEESISSYNKALEQDSHFPGSHTGIAANLMFMGKHEEARQQMNAYLDQARDDGERRQALFATATIAIDEGNAEEALKEIGEAMALSEAIGDKGSMSGDAQAQGNILFETGNADEAAAHFQKSYELAMESNLSDAIKKNVEVGRHQNLAKVALLKKDLDTAKAEAGKFMEGISADNPFQQRTAHELFGLVALAGEDYETAVKHLKQANQQSAYVLYKLAKAQHGAGNKAQSKALCEKVVNLNTLPTLRSAMVRNKAKELAASL